LSSVLDLHLHKYVAEVEHIVELANKESKISTQLKKIESQWATLELQFGVGSNGVSTIRRPDEVLVILEENMAVLQSMQGQGRYVEHFIDDVNKWQRLLNQAETILYDWLDVQQSYSSLETIFLGSKDIRIQLPEDSNDLMKSTKNGVI
jgi:dynein heavy chain